MTVRHRILASLGLLAAVGVVGCGGAQSTTVVRPAVRGASRSAIVGAVFRDRAYVAQGDELTRAELELTRRCMARRGLVYRGELPPLPSAPALTLPAAGAGYGLASMVRVDVAVLRRLRDRSSDPQARYVERLPARRRAAYLRALGGSPGQRASLRGVPVPGQSYPTGGCSASAIATLYGSTRAFYTLNAEQNAVSGMVLGRLRRDRGFRRAVGRWHGCMRARGMRYASPLEAREAIFQTYLSAHDRARVRRRELATAAADRACGETSGLYREQARTQRAAVAALPARALGWISALVRSRAAAERRARAIVGG